MSALEKLFEPRGIAVIGASADPTRTGGQTVDALRRYRYAGAIYPVNPRYGEVQGLRCYPDVTAIDGPCDIAVIALPAAQVPDTVAQCGRHGIPFGVVLGGGFRETGPEGAAREQRMVEQARSYGMRLIGPNCLGFVSVPNRVYAAFGSLTREPELQPGGVSAVIQSGGFGNSLVIRCALAGVGFRHVTASGNEADLSAPELIDAYVDDPQTRAILLYLEGLSDGRAFMAAAQRALAAGKPVIAWKAGNTRQGARAAASHTANLTGSHDVFRAAFRQCGVIEVHDVDEAADFALCLVAGRLPKGRNAAVMGGSGGSAVVFADTADEVGITLASPREHTMAVLRANLPSVASLENPIDYAAGYPRAGDEHKLLAALDAVLADPDIHQLGLLYATVLGEPLRLGASMLAQAAARSDKPILAFSVQPPELAGEGRRILDQAGIPVLPSPARVARAMGMLADYAEALARRDTAPERSEPIAPPALPSLGAGALDEHASKQLLARFGIPVTRDALLPLDAATLPSALPYPLAVKIVSPAIAHKTDVGGVRLGIADSAALQQAVAEVVANARRARADAPLTGVLASEMVSGGLETIVGVVNDPGFGPVVAFGLGGVLAETVRDVTFRVAPFGLEAAREMIGELRARALFDGVRGQPPRDIEALAQTLVRVASMAWVLKDRLVELDINPLLVRAAGEGVVAADALVVLRAPQEAA